jgi:hypothetical protein
VPGWGTPALHREGDLMANDLDGHHRRSIRLKGYDYALAGAYFVTISTQDQVLFGDIMAGVIRLNEAGRMVSTSGTHCPQFGRRSGCVRRNAQSHPAS